VRAQTGFNHRQFTPTPSTQNFDDRESQIQEFIRLTNIGNDRVDQSQRRTARRGCATWPHPRFVG
jgi:hypothetical protein